MLRSDGGAGMPSWFLSCHSPDEKLAARLKKLAEAGAFIRRVDLIEFTGRNAGQSTHVFPPKSVWYFRAL